MPRPLDNEVLDGILEIAQTQRGPLAAVARNEGLSPEDAVDCVEEGLCTLIDLARAGEARDVTDPAPLVSTIIRNVARNHRRRHFRARPHDTIDGLEIVDSGIAFPDDLMTEAVERVRLRACVA